MEDDYLMLEDLSCVDAEGDVFEQYPVLYVGKDIERTSDGSQKNFTPYEAAKGFGERDFCPSFALSCAVFDRIWRKHINDPLARQILGQYKNKGIGNGWHAQNTLLAFDSGHVLHYPIAADFGEMGKVNAGRSRVALSIDKSRLCDGPLEAGLRDDATRRYVRQLTGLKEPDVLVDIGKDFGKPAYLWFPWSGRNGAKYTGTRAAWLGCDSSYFGLFGGSVLDDNDAARRVRASGSEHRAEGAKKFLEQPSLDTVAAAAMVYVKGMDHGQPLTEEGFRDALAPLYVRSK